MVKLNLTDEDKAGLIEAINVTIGGGSIYFIRTVPIFFESFTDVVERIPQFIEAVYNKKRVHSGIPGFATCPRKSLRL